VLVGVHLDATAVERVLGILNHHGATNAAVGTWRG
jgi:hypothetical protein